MVSSRGTYRVNPSRKQIFNFHPSNLQPHLHRFLHAVRVHAKGKRFRKFVESSGVENVPRTQRGMETYSDAVIDLLFKKR